MNKKLLILLGILGALAALYFLVLNKPFRSFKGKDDEFSIADTGSISKIFMADGRGGKVLLEKKAYGSWMVNGAYEADYTKVDILLQTLHEMKMRNPVGESAYNNVIRDLTATAVKVEVYMEDDLYKTFYVGQMTPDYTGTYMMNDGAKNPYVVHVPGFMGYLTPRFLTNADKWRSKLVFNHAANEITKITVQYPLTPIESFTITNGTTPVLTDANNQSIPVSEKFLKYYLGAFTNLYAEGFDDEMSAAAQDSVFKTDVYCAITLELTQNRKTKLQLHIKGIDRRTKQRTDDQGNVLTYDTEKYYGFLNEQPTLMYIQHYNFGRILRKLSEIKAIKE